MKQQKGVIVIIAFLALGTLLLLGSYFLSFTLTEARISKSQKVAVKTYYLTEAGINEAIWKLKNDSVWKDGFETGDCDNWLASFTRNYIQGSTTTVSIQNSQCARGEIIATSTLALAKGKTAQRVIKVKVLKSLGSLTENSPLFAGAPSGESDIYASILNVYNGNIFINNNLNIKVGSQVSVYDDPATPTSTDPENQEGQVLAVGNVKVSLTSNLHSSSICAKNECSGPCQKCPADLVNMPAIDFDSDNPNSYKSKAEAAGQCLVEGKNSSDHTVITSDQCLFSEDQFEELLWEIGKGGILILNPGGSASPIYYVEGGIDLKGEREIEVNGVLVAEETVNIGEKSKWKGDYGFNQITINDPGQDIPSGLLTKGKMNFGFYSSFRDINVTGIIYSLEEIRLTSFLDTFNVKGGIIARKFSLISGWGSLNIDLDEDIIKEGIWGGPQPPGEEKPPYSPVVTVEHWEETY